MTIRIGGALRFYRGNLLRTSPCILRIYPLFSFLLRQLVFAVSVFPLYPQLIRGRLMVQEMLLEAVELFFLPSLRHRRDVGNVFRH